LSFRLPVLVLLLAAAPGGCSSSSAPDAAEANAAGSGGTAALRLSFADPATLPLALGEVATVAVQVAPAEAASVRFALLGEHLDGTLDQSLVRADDSGLATVTLRAPRQTATFRLRASLDGGASVERAIAASGGGFGALLVTASYAGKRPTPSWVATADASVERCADLPGFPPPDGPLLTSGDGPAPLRLDGVPVGQRVVVTVRAGHAVAGCVEVDQIRLGEERPVQVAAKNVPIGIENASLDLTLTRKPQATGWSKLIEGWSSDFRERFLGGNTTGGRGAGALLDTMLVLTPAADRPAFQAARQAASWDSALGALAGPGPLVIDAWLMAARQKLAAGQQTAGGRLEATGAPPGKATLVFSSLLDLGADDGLGSKMVSWQGELDDKVQLAGDVSFLPSQAVGKATAAEALALSGQTTVGAALQGATDCNAVAGALVSKGQAFAQCGTNCVRKLCVAALGAMWQRALDGEGAVAQLSFAVSGPATVDDSGQIVSFAGAWVGSLSEGKAGATPTQLAGDASATPPSDKSKPK
jgi:hypothetical protein